MKQIVQNTIFFISCLCLAVGQSRAAIADYDTDLELIRDIGTELWESMDPEDQRLFPRRCVVVAEDATPWVKPVEIRRSAVAGRYVAVSRGFIDLCNNLSHAKAIDVFEPGYFQHYLNRLATESGRFPLQRLPGVYHAEYWTSRIVNEQESNFNQMVAIVLAMQLSHHALGHYDKHQADLENPKTASTIIQLLRGSEWSDAFSLAIHLALQAGYGVEGFEALCEALDRMPQRPSWTNYFLPRRLDVSRLEREMERSERDFFNFSGEF